MPHQGKTLLLAIQRFFSIRFSKTFLKNALLEEQSDVLHKESVQSGRFPAFLGICGAGHPNAPHMILALHRMDGHTMDGRGLGPLRGPS